MVCTEPFYYTLSVQLHGLHRTIFAFWSFQPSGYDAVYIGIWVPTFCVNLLPPHSGWCVWYLGRYWGNEGLWNVFMYIHIPIYTLLDPKRLTTSLTSLWEPQILHSVAFLLPWNGCWVASSTLVENTSWFLGTRYAILCMLWRHMGIAPCILNLNSRCNQVVTVMSRCFTASERTTGTYWVWGWVGPQSLSWCFEILIWQPSFASGRNRTPDCSVHSLCTIMTGVPPSYFCKCQIWHQWEFPCINTFTPNSPVSIPVH
jgi:hypothetical protein